MFAPLNITTREKELHCAFLQEQSFKTVPMHWHSEYELSYASSGSFSAFVEGVQYEIPEGHALLITSGERHLYFSTDDCTIETLLFEPFSDNDELSSALSAKAKTTQCWSDAELRSFRSSFEDIKQAYKCSSDLLFSLKMRAAIYSLLSLFVSMPYSREASADDNAQNAKIMARMEIVLRYISENYTEDITLPQLSSIAGYVPTYFSRVFKECTGLTFYDYLTSYRIAMAKKILADPGHKSIVEAATQSGFGSVKTFDRVFKERVGISPLRYRKKCLGSV